MKKNGQNKSKLKAVIAAILLMILLFLSMGRYNFYILSYIMYLALITRLIFYNEFFDRFQIFNKVRKRYLIIFYSIFLTLVFWIIIILSHDIMSGYVYSSFMIAGPIISLLFMKFYKSPYKSNENLVYSISLMLMYIVLTNAIGMYFDSYNDNFDFYGGFPIISLSIVIPIVIIIILGILMALLGNDNFLDKIGISDSKILLYRIAIINLIMTIIFVFGLFLYMQFILVR